MLDMQCLNNPNVSLYMGWCKLFWSIPSVSEIVRLFSATQRVYICLDFIIIIIIFSNGIIYMP